MSSSHYADKKSPTTFFSASFACVTAVTERPLISSATAQVEDEKPPSVLEVGYDFARGPSVCAAVSAAMQISGVDLFHHWHKMFLYSLLF